MCSRNFVFYLTRLIDHILQHAAHLIRINDKIVGLAVFMSIKVFIMFVACDMLNKKNILFLCS